MTVSWGSSEMSADYTPSQPDFPTTYRDDWLVGKLVSASPPPIEKRGSWGSCLRLPHHLYRRVARGEVAESPLITPLPKLQLPHHYREEWSRGEVSLSTSSPPIEKRGSWGMQSVRWFMPPPSPPRRAGTASRRGAGAFVAAGACSPPRGAHRRRPPHSARA